MKVLEEVKGVVLEEGYVKMPEEVKGVVLGEDRKMKHLVDVEQRTKDLADVKGGRLNVLGCVEDQRINLAYLGWKLENHKDDVTKTKPEVEQKKRK